MAYDDLIEGVQELIASAPEEATEHLSFDGQAPLGTGLPSTALRGPEDFSPTSLHVPEGVAESFSKYEKWHGALGKAMNPAAAGAAMAAVGFPAASMLGAGIHQPQSGLVIDDDKPLTNAGDTFGTTSKVNRLLELDYSKDELLQPNGYKKLASKLGGNDKAAGFLRAFGEHIAETIPSYSLYRFESGDTNAGLKAAAMISAQVEFADEWASFEFVGDAAPVVLREWHKLITTGEGNADVAVDGITKLVRAIEWVQHPELLISPMVALSHASLDDDQADVGLRVIQWQERPLGDITDKELAARILAAERMHPSGLVEPLVDNVRTLLMDAMGEDVEEFWANRREMGGRKLDLKDVGHVAGLKRIAPSTTQMKKAVYMVARELGEVAGKKVQPEEVNAVAAEAMLRRETIEGEFMHLLTGRGVPRLPRLRDVDAGTDFRRYRAKHRTISMEADLESAVDAATIIVETSSDGTHKVMTEHQPIRNRAAGFIDWHGKHVTVARRPAIVSSASEDFENTLAEGHYFPLGKEERHPAFEEGPRALISVDVEGASTDATLRTLEQAVADVRGEVDQMGQAKYAYRDEDGNLQSRSRRVSVVSYPTAQDLKRAASKMSRREDFDQSKVTIQWYVNTDMDAPAGYTKQWEHFTKDSAGGLAAKRSAVGFDTSTTAVPYWTMTPGVTEGSPGSPLDQADGALPWSEGETLHVFIPGLDEGQMPVSSHDRDDLAMYPSDQVVAATRQRNGNVSVALPGDDGKVETVLAKQAHQLMRALGRNQVSMAVANVDD